MAQEQENAILDAAEAGKLSLLTRLLEGNPSLLNARSESGRSPLQEAVFGGSYDAVKLLLTRGADVHAKDERGWTPLHEAAYNSTAQVVGLLLSFGAEVGAADNRGKTPLDYAVEDGFDDIAALLERGREGGKRLAARARSNKGMNRTRNQRASHPQSCRLAGYPRR